HVAREYSVHPLELIAVGAVMTPRERLVVLERGATIAQVAQRLMQLDADLHYVEYPVVDAAGALVGFVPHAAILQRAHQSDAPEASLESLAHKAVAVHPEDRVRAAASVMASSGRRSVAVVDDSGAWVGILAVSDLLEAWKRGLASETRRVRVRSLRRLSPFLLRQKEARMRQ
ncbi:MAG TPA: CBS domain-containing protein, partial [Candidatus Baltobacteraceae bacterium]|nr:CBS domain-containing protein [Candidatus Baltobacteraceae bacterium]